MIISISGRIGSGKDTVGKIVNYLLTGGANTYESIEGFLEFYDDGIGKYPFTTQKWAGKLKDMTCLILGCTREQLEDREFKNTELGEEWWYYTNTLFAGSNKILKPYIGASKKLQDDLNWYIHKLTPRKIMQLIGTDCGRDIIHPNIWILSLMSEYIGDIEKWEAIKDYEDSYEVSSFGRVRSLDRVVNYGKDKGDYHTRKGQLLKPTLSGNYLTVSLSGKTYAVHSLVAKTFLKNNYSESLVVNHRDFNTHNNFYKNLEWITQRENIQYNKVYGVGNIGTKQKDSKLTELDVSSIRNLLKEASLTQRQIAEIFEVSPTTITDIKKGRKWGHVGKTFPVIKPIVPVVPPNWIITDTRFPNEVEAVKKKGGLNIRVERKTELRYPVLWEEFQSSKFDSWDDYLESKDLLDKVYHSSETALDNYKDWDEVIDNNGTIEDLIQKVRLILIKHNLI